MTAAIPMHAMVLAAGRGERMRPLTDITPKPMLKVRGKPLIQWHLEALAKAGITEVIINLAHLGEQIRDHVGSGLGFGLHVRYSQEPEGALETAGGIAAAEPWRDHRGQIRPGPFLVINADIFTDWPISEALDIARHWPPSPEGHAVSEVYPTPEGQTLGRDRLPHGSSPRCHLILVDNPRHHPRGDFGLAPQAGSQAIARVIARPEVGSLTFSGIGVYDPNLFNAVTPGQRAALAPILHQAVADGRCTGSHYRGSWSDVGTPERLEQLNCT